MVVKKVAKLTCDKWKGGLCSVFKTAVYCPKERADNAKPGECITHPLYTLRSKLAEMKAASFSWVKFQQAYPSPQWIDKAYDAFQKKEKKYAPTR